MTRPPMAYAATRPWGPVHACGDCGAEVQRQAHAGLVEIDSGRPHRCPARAVVIRDAMECNCGGLCYTEGPFRWGQTKYAGPTGPALHSCIADMVKDLAAERRRTEPAPLPATGVIPGAVPLP